jgi:hypothetical protein
MDSAAVVDVRETTPTILRPADLPTDVSIRWLDSPLEQERRLFDVRLPAGIAFGQANGLNRSLADPGIDRRRLIILSVGKSRLDVIQALAMLDLGLERWENSASGFVRSGCRGRSIRTLSASSVRMPPRFWSSRKSGLLSKIRWREFCSRSTPPNGHDSRARSTITASLSCLRGPHSRRINLPR